MIADLMQRLRALLAGRRWHRDLDDEMRFHLEQDVAARIRAGADPATARREAALAFGGVEQFKEASRDASGVRPLDELAADARLAMRTLRRNAGFTATAILVLGVAIGAATAVFSVVRTVLLADLPYPRPDRLMRVYQQNSITNRWSLSVVDYQAIRDYQRTFDAFGVARGGTAALGGAGTPEEVRLARVTSGIFRTLSTTVAAGRLIEPADEPPGAPPVVVVTFAFAAERLGGAPAAIGRSITLDGVSHTVIGVLPRGVDQLAGMQVAIWPSYQPETPLRRGPFGLRGIGVLKEGVTLEDAARDLASISERIFPIWEAGFRDRVARLTPFSLRETMVGAAHSQLRLFAGAVALVLLVAIANVATLVLVRTAAREHELSVRSTLGASRGRLARLVVTESLVLTALAAVASVGVAALGLRLVGVIAPNLPRAQEIAFDGRTILLTIVLAVISGVLVSLSPVIAVVRGRQSSAHADTRRAGGGRRTNLIRGALVAGEFALAVPLLAAAALLAASFLRLQQVDPGYNAERTFTVRLSLPAVRYPNDTVVQEFWTRVLQRAAETPGVLAVGLGTATPPDNQGASNNFTLVTHPVAPGASEPVSPWDQATPGFFEALEIPLLEGRMFTDADTLPVVIVSRSWAERYFPGEQAIGQQLIGGGCYDCPRITVIGIVGNVKYQGLAGDGDGVYEPLAQGRLRSVALFVRTSADPAGFIEPVLARLRGLDPELPLAGLTMAAQVRRALADPGRWTAVLTAFAATALALSAMGIFGLMSYVVRRQRREIGVRMALGAAPRDVAQMIVTRGMRYVAAGTVIGLGVALIQGPWLATLLYGVTPRDPLTITAVTVVLLGAALLACLLPGIRAARIRPIEAIADD